MNHGHFTSMPTPQCKIGFMPLTDCAPLVVAKELGFFKEFGLDVELVKQNSWASMRDKLSAGVIDMGQLLAPMPLAGALGLDKQCENLIAPFVLSRNGNAITISRDLHTKSAIGLNFHQGSEASYLKPLIHELKQKGEKLTFATVYPYSCHYLQLQSYFQQAGIAQSDVNIVIISPSNMVSALRQGDIDGFCVGGPYNAKAVREGIGVTVATSIDIWPDLPEKVLAFKKHWYLQQPDTAYALLKAVQRACRWLEVTANRFEAARMLSKRDYLNTAIDIIAPSLLGSCLTFPGAEPRSVPAYNRFTCCHEQGSNRPDNHDMSQLYRYFKLSFADQLDQKHLLQLKLEDIYSTALYDRSTNWRMQSNSALRLVK
ncbi:CmpA/NrtA family ABC transporter substrate-binding protein [Thalassotalea sp. Y01]|uniref:CmpA/NrtA family ABC transporter substrate-binding protein n=1 Tax=Thalassotalea sp. Y01 TaxID=2729613 RepID=UPI00145DC418|nr:CmpA/NrtA family ABC transporter substrate-binding protein [Thalassotalea sp. Y01]NMP16701.1 ABC transporter substrate-binding protein [Thalassotalea sp. Y01]